MDQKIVCCHKVRISSAASAYKVILGALVSSSSRPYSANQSTSLRRPQCYGPKRIRYIDTHRRLILALTSSGSASGSRSTGHADDTNADGDLDINAPGPSAPPAAAAALGRRQRGRAVVDNTLDRGLEARDTSGVAAVVRRSKTTSIPGAAALEQGVPASASNEDSRRDVAASAKYGATGGKSLRLDPDVKAAAEAATDGSMHTVPPPSRPVVMDQTGAGSRSGGGGLLSRLARGKGAATVPPRRSRGRADSNGIGKGDDGGGNSRRSTIRSPSGGSSNPLSPDLPNNVSQVSNTATVASTDNEAGIHLDVTSEGFLDGSDTLPVALTAAAAAAVTVEVEAMAATTPLLTPASPPPAPSPDGFMAREDRPASSATILTGTSNNSSGSSSSSSSNTRGAGGSGSTSGGIRVEGGVIDPLVARLARVVAYVERELLGDTRGVAAATAVAAVHPDVSRLPPPSPPASALQPLELFAEAPITGRLLAKAAAEAAPQREVSSAPGTDEWKLLGGPTPPPLLQLAAETRDAVPNHLSGISNESDFGSSGTGQGAGGQSGGDSDSDSSSSRPTALVADELFRAREQEQLRYKSYLRQFVLRTAPAGSTGRASSGRADGVDDNRGEQMRKQQRRQQQQQRGQRSQTKSKEMVEPIDGNLSLTTEGGNSTSELQRALFGEIASTSDWLQLRTLLNVARETNYLDLSIVAAVFKQAADLLIEVEGGGTGPEGSGRLSVQSFARSNGVIIGTFAGGGGGGGGSGGGTVDDSGSPLMTPASLATAFGPAEVEAYGIFCSQLTAAATRALGRRQAPKKSGGLGADADGDHAGSGHDVAQIAYGMGVLQLRSRTLYDTVLRVSGEQLLALTARRTAAAATTAAAAAVLVRGGSTANGRATASGPTVFAEMAAAASAAATGGGAASTETAGLLASRQHGNSTAQPPPPPKPWTPSDIAYLAWGIALSYGGSSAAETSKDTADTAAAEAAQSSLLPLPDKAWLRALCNASIDSLAICAPTLMWRLLWSMARLSYVPPEEWMRLFLDRVRNSLADFEPQELCRIAWSLGALEVVPDKLWMRALVGQLHNRLRDLTADQLVSLYGALARLGYAPRPEVGSGFHAAAVRLMPLMSGSQLAALAYYAASFDRWRPSASFLEALARAARPHAASFSSAEASRLLWAWSRSASQKQQVLAASPPQQELQPQQRPQLQPQWQPQQQGAEGELLPPQLIDVLLARVLNGMRAGTTDGNDLSMTLWALAVMRRIPGAEWMAAWWRAAADPRVAASFDDTCVAQSLWAAAQLRTLAGPVEEASMYGSIDGDGGDSGGDPSQPPPQAAAAAAAAAAVAAMLSRMSGLLRRTSTANLSTTIAALADLQYRYCIRVTWYW
ncbi:hypothetical protein Vafri_14946 [Volvox africanus]|uniref:Uncharacterized protein n=1 Tax=Volvox africanus TaxID=51714 RepID=A0A8J4BK45_9CHLO|nr:hypothetical protein Vafri_14946 [Volvox africanus]